MDKYFRPLVLSILYVFSFVLSFVLGALLIYVFKEDSLAPDSDDGLWEGITGELMSKYMVYMQLMSSAIAVFFVWSMNMADFKKAYDFRNVDWKNAWKPIVAAPIYLYTVACIYGLIPHEGTSVETFSELGDSIWGKIAICLIAPAAIELVFRESIMRFMLNKGATALQALLYSSFCYSLMNVIKPIMMPQGFALALVFGFIYLKNRNIVLTTIIQVMVYVAMVALSFFYKDYTKVHPEAIKDTEVLDIIEIILYLIPLMYPCYRLLRSYYTDEPVVPPTLWFKMKRVVVKMRR